MVKQGLGPLPLAGRRVRYCTDCVWLSFDPEELPGLVSSSDSDAIKKWVSSFLLVAEGRGTSFFLTVSPNLDERSLVIALEIDGYGEDVDELITLLILAKKLASMIGSSYPLEVQFHALDGDDELLDTLALLVVIRDVDMTHFLKLAGRLEDALAKARVCLENLDEVYDELLEANESMDRELPDEGEVLGRLSIGECDKNTILETVKSLMTKENHLSETEEYSEDAG